jgi:hypothetical protein
MIRQTSDLSGFFDAPGRFAARFGLAMGLSFGLTSVVHAQCQPEVEPNEQPEIATALTGAGCVSGTIGGGDQEILKLTTDAAALWTVDLSGQEGTVTTFDLFRLSGEPPTPSGRLTTMNAGGGPRELLLPPGTWMIGLSAAGEGTWDWRLDLASEVLPAADAAPVLDADKPVFGELVPGTALTIPLTVTPKMQRKRWSLTFDTLPGSGVTLAIDAPGGQMLSRTVFAEGPVILPGLGLDAGDYSVTLTAMTAEPVPFRLTLTGEGPRTKTHEDEPNDLTASARALKPGKPILGEISAPDDKDLWQFDVTEAMAGRTLSLSLGSTENVTATDKSAQQARGAGISRTLCLRDAVGTDLQCRSGATITLGDLVLAPGQYFAAVSGPPEPGVTYEVALRQGPKPAENAEIEPNDVSAQATPLRPGVDMTGRTLGLEYDRFALEVTGEPKLWRFDGIGTETLRLEDTQGVQIAQRSMLDGSGETMVIDDVLLTEGRYTLMIEGLDKSYTLRATEKGPPPEGLESEPNDDASIANLLRVGETRTGSLPDAGDRDHLRFAVPPDAAVDLILSRLSGPAMEVSLTGPNGEQVLEMTGETLTLPDGLPAGDYVLSLRSSSYDDQVVRWQAALRWRDPVSIADPHVTMTANADADSLASHLPWAQSVTVKLSLEALRGVDGVVPVVVSPLTGIKVDPGAEISLSQGENREVDLTLTFPADLPRDRDLPVTILFAQPGVQPIGAATLRFVVRSDAPPVKAFADVAVPPEMRGGFNLAAPGFGAIIPGETAETMTRISPDNPKFLFDGIDGTDIFRAPVGGEVTVVFGPPDPVPVAGFALTPHAAVTDYQESQLLDFTVSLSPDGSTFTEVLSGTLGPKPGETYFTLPAPFAAKAAKLTVRSGTRGPDYPVALAEWKVIAEPGQPEGVRINLADPARGGHLVRIEPRPNMTPRDLVTVLAPGGAQMTVTGAAPMIVVGFADTRKARFDEVVWVEDVPGDGFYTSVGTVDISVADNPLGPWRDLGPVTVDATGEAKLTLPEPIEARFVRFEARPATPDAAQGWLLPDEIRITEVPATAETPSAVGEWGMGVTWSGLDLGPVTPPTSEAEDTDSADAPQLLAWGGTGEGVARLGVDEDFFTFTAPEGETHALLTLSGEPFVTTTLQVSRADGTILDLRRGPPSPGQRRYEVAVTPGETYLVRISEPPRSIALAFDVSGSLAGYWTAIRTGLSAFAEAPVPGRDFVRFLPFDKEFAGPDWADQPSVVRRDLAGLTAADTGSGTEQTVLTAARELQKREGARVLVLLTDGASPTFDLGPQMWATLEKTGVEIVSAYIGGYDDPVREKDLLQDLAASGGGFFQTVMSQADIDLLMEKTVDWVRRPARYTLEVRRSDLPPPEPATLAVSGAALASAGQPAPIDAGDPDTSTPVVSGTAPAVELIIDASGSMLQQMPSGGRRIDVAHRVLDDLIRRRIPANTLVALRAFGDTYEGSCDTVLRAPLAPIYADYLAPLAAGIEPVNLAKTPIAASLAATEGDLATAPGPRVVVLVTDGEETCDGDPEAEIARLRSLGIDVTVNIVGFALDDPALDATFARWAEVGGGTYLPAADEATLSEALTQAVTEAFTVLAADGRVVAQGQVGGAPVELPAGTWKVVIGKDRVVFDAVVLGEGESRTLALDN